MGRKTISIAALILVAGIAFQGGAGASDKQAVKKEAKPAAVATGVLTEGEVIRIDKAAGTATIKHGPMPKLDMPSMTMPYRVKDKATLEKLKPGDKVAFDADVAGGVYTVVRMEKLK